MDQQFSWDNLPHTTSGTLSTSMVFPNDHQSTLLDSSLLSWPQDDQVVWSVTDACTSKRLKLEDRLQDVHEKADDAAFQPFYLTSCFQAPGDLNKDLSGFSYLPQPYLCKVHSVQESIKMSTDLMTVLSTFRCTSACNGQQPTGSEPMEDSKSESTDRFYGHPASSTIYPQTSQFSCYPNPDGTGFLEGMFTNTTTTTSVVAPSEGGMLPTTVGYDTVGQYGFDPTTGHFLAPVSFFPGSNQSEGITSHPLNSLDPQAVATSHSSKIHHQHHSHHNHNQQQQHHHQQHRSQQLEQHRSLEETASISSNGSVTGVGGIAPSAYFWQYNAQCKGPKAVRLINGGANSPLSTSTSPLSSCYDGSSSFGVTGVGNCSIAAHSMPQYPLVVFEDPVQKRNDLVHCSKLRRGDGNDVTPNILRLRSMGDELDRLSAQITRQGEIIMAGGGGGGVGGTAGGDLGALLPSSRFDMEAVAPPSWRVEEAKREKNKLASKICRLKKKAFHESNKIKYTGLGLEYKELASLITSLKKMISQRVSPSLARLLQQPQQVGEKSADIGVGASNAGADAEKPTSSGDLEQAGALFARAKWLTSTTHVTRVAGRMDAFVEEVLNLAKTTQAKHPLIKRLSSSCNSTTAMGGGNREITTSVAPKFSPIEAPLNHLPAETVETSFTYSTPSVYEYTQRPGFPTALDLSNMIRSGAERSADYHQANYDCVRQAEWSDYSTIGMYNAVSMGNDAIYDTTAYITAYHPQVGTTSAQEFPATYPPQFYDAMGTQNMTGYQSLQQASGKVVGGEISVSADVPNADNGIAVNCPQRLSVIT
uniref:BZIP domain-containing protein n=1 Tax=Echinococcus granulosus TaxID=6210 RepID=A0A068WAU1_ECHGR|nr:hypothetical protein EgrG_000949000 [Echinococcus granulosus]